MELHVVTGAGLGALGPVVEPDRSAPLVDRLAQVRRLSAGGPPVAFRIDPADGPSAAVATAAVEAGATVLVLADGRGDERGAAALERAGRSERDVRRAAHVAATLVAARVAAP